MDDILLEVDFDDFIVVCGERIETETEAYGVTFRLCRRDAARIGAEIITVSATSVLEDCQLPKATELPAVETEPTNEPTNSVKTPVAQLSLFGGTVDTEQPELSLF